MSGFEKNFRKISILGVGGGKKWTFAHLTFWGSHTWVHGYMGPKSQKKNRKISKMPKTHQKWVLA